MNDDAFDSLIKRARGGDGDAIRQIVRVYEPDLQLMVRARLPEKLRSQFDTMDFVQEVWGSFLIGEADPKVAFDDSKHLRGYLAGIVENKVLAQYRRRTKIKKYDLNREEPLVVRKGSQEITQEVPSHDPSPSQTMQVEDRFEQLTAGRSDIDKEIVRLRSHGMTYDEIARQVGRNEKTVRRVLDDVRTRWEAHQ